LREAPAEDSSAIEEAVQTGELAASEARGAGVAALDVAERAERTRAFAGAAAGAAAKSAAFTNEELTFHENGVSVPVSYFLDPYPDDNGHAVFGDDKAAAAVFAAKAAKFAALWGVDTFDIRFAFDSLLRRSNAEKWTDSTPVPPTVFLPFHDTPPERPTEPDAPEPDIVLRAFIRDGVDPEVAQQKLLDLYNAMNDYTIAKFGKPLPIKDFQEYVLVGVPAGVPS
jgi:hypothetical protein